MFCPKTANALPINQNIPFKRLTAIGFLALLFFVQGVKVFHNHNCFSNGKGLAAVMAVQDAIAHGHDVLEADAATCAVCEFHFLKDISHQVDEPVLAVPVFAYYCPDVLTVTAVLQDLSVTSLRGPPTV